MVEQKQPLGAGTPFISFSLASFFSFPSYSSPILFFALFSFCIAFFFVLFTFAHFFFSFFGPTKAR